MPTTTNTPFTATFTFSEPVTGFELADIAIVNGTATAFDGGGAIYTALITPTTDGPVTIDVAADVAKVASGNNNIATAQRSVSTTMRQPELEFKL